MYVVTLLKPSQILYGEYELQLVNFEKVCDAIFTASRNIFVCRNTAQE